MRRESVVQNMIDAQGTAIRALSLILTPHGRVLLATDETGASSLTPDLSHRLQQSFSRGGGHGLLQLGAGEVGIAMPAAFGYWREFGARYVAAVCTLSSAAADPESDTPTADPAIPPPPAEELEALAAAAPPMTGAEYLTASMLRSLWQEIDAAWHAELIESGASRRTTTTAVHTPQRGRKRPHRQSWERLAPVESGAQNRQGTQKHGTGRCLWHRAGGNNRTPYEEEVRAQDQAKAHDQTCEKERPQGA